MSSVADEFDAIMKALYERTLRETGGHYNPHVFRDMVDKYGGIQTAKLLLQSQDPQYGLARLWELGRLDLSVEFHALQPRFATLFTDGERREAMKRLRDYGFNVDGDGILTPIIK